MNLPFRSSQPQYDGLGGRVKVDPCPVPKIKSKITKKTKPSAKQIKQTNTIKQYFKHSNFKKTKTLDNC